jgi:hypothetical protein
LYGIWTRTIEREVQNYANSKPDKVSAANEYKKATDDALVTRIFQLKEQQHDAKVQEKKIQADIDAFVEREFFIPWSEPREWRKRPGRCRESKIMFSVSELVRVLEANIRHFDQKEPELRQYMSIAKQYGMPMHICPFDPQDTYPLTLKVEQEILARAGIIAEFTEREYKTFKGIKRSELVSSSKRRVDFVSPFSDECVLQEYDNDSDPCMYWSILSMERFFAQRIIDTYYDEDVSDALRDSRLFVLVWLAGHMIRHTCEIVPELMSIILPRDSGETNSRGIYGTLMRITKGVPSLYSMAKASDLDIPEEVQNVFQFHGRGVKVVEIDEHVDRIPLLGFTESRPNNPDTDGAPRAYYGLCQMVLEALGVRVECLQYTYWNSTYSIPFRYETISTDEGMDISLCANILVQWIGKNSNSFESFLGVVNDVLQSNTNMKTGGFMAVLEYIINGYLGVSWQMSDRHLLARGVETIESPSCVQLDEYYQRLRKCRLNYLMVTHEDLMQSMHREQEKLFDLSRTFVRNILKMPDISECDADVPFRDLPKFHCIRCTEHNCPGYVPIGTCSTPRCNLCNVQHCKDCWKVYHDGECMIDDLENVKKMTGEKFSQCPKCRVIIEKTDNTCNDMWCSACHYKFDFVTLEHHDRHNEEHADYVKRYGETKKFDISIISPPERETLWSEGLGYADIIESLKNEYTAARNVNFKNTTNIKKMFGEIAKNIFESSSLVLRNMPTVLETVVWFSYLLLVESDPIVRRRILDELSSIVLREHRLRRHLVEFPGLGKEFVKMVSAEIPIDGKLLDTIDTVMSSIREGIDDVRYQIKDVDQYLRAFYSLRC